jgi:23S rRNA pseudouridine1911/1915/1917 synthase
VLPAGPFSERTLLELVRASDPSRGTAAPAHRLGRGTSGLVAFGKTALGRASLVRQFREQTLTKTYLAWVEGARLPDSFAARQPIGRVTHGPLAIHVAAAHGRAALTRVRVLRRLVRDSSVGAALAATAESRLKPLPQEPLPRGPLPQHTRERALVAAQPITGRPDQIRIHLASAGAPIVGDPLFGPGGLPTSDVPPGAGGYLLHAAALSFAHPASGARIKARSLPGWLQDRAPSRAHRPNDARGTFVTEVDEFP